MNIPDIISVITIILILIQLIVMFFAYKADNERKRKQSTIEYINNIRGIYKPIRKNLDEKFPGDDRVINLEEIDDKLNLEIKELLSTVEHLSVGLNTNVYDFDIFFRMSGSYFFGIYKKLNPHILNAQKNRPTNYIEFEAICKRIELAKEKHNYKMTILKNGKIKYS
jgi:hypothetical protein